MASAPQTQSMLWPAMLDGFGPILFLSGLKSSSMIFRHPPSCTRRVPDPLATMTTRHTRGLNYTRTPSIGGIGELVCQFLLGSTFDLVTVGIIQARPCDAKTLYSHATILSHRVYREGSSWSMWPCPVCPRSPAASENIDIVMFLPNIL
jgi:hypothetical protein